LTWPPVALDAASADQTGTVIMKVTVPKEALPGLDIVASPTVLCDGEDAYVCYRASGGGNVVLKFEEVIDFHLTQVNVDGLKGCRYPVQPWKFNEIVGGEEVARWKVLDPRFWIITFRNFTIEILFGTVSVVGRDKGGPRRKTLMNALADLGPSPAD
jgi:hypothetical protein